MANHCSNAKCGICFQEFSAIEELDKHISAHDIHHAFRCNFCENVYSDVTELQEHVVSHNVDTPYLCGRCDRRYNSSTYLMLHQSYNINAKSDHESSDSCDHNSSVTDNQISTCDASSVSNHRGNVGSCAAIPKSDSLSPFKTPSVTFQKSTANHFPQSQNILPSYVKLRDIGPLLTDLEKGKEAIVHNSDDEPSSSKEVCEYLAGLPKDLNKLTLCMSCCLPFLLSKPHTCQSSQKLMSKKCGFCEVVFNDKSSLQKHVLKIHQVKQNFCCSVCSLVLTKERDYIQHVICEHSHSGTSLQFKNRNQPISKSRRLKGSPQKMIPSYHVIDKKTNLSEEDDYLLNEHDMNDSSDNGNVTSERGNCLAEKSRERIYGNNMVYHGNGTSSTSQYSVCHNCCHIVQNLIQHMKLHSYQERLKCGFCKLTLKTEAAARHHYRNSHKERNRISCNSCKWYGVSEKRYIKHCLSVHKEDMYLTLPELPQQNGLSVVNPEPSNTEIETSKDLSSNSKTKNESSVCRYCGVVSQNLIDHLTKHQPRDFKQCGFCKKKFSHRDKASSHFRKIHKDRQNLFCQFCREFRGSEEKYIEHFTKNHPNGQITNNIKSFNVDISKSELTVNGDNNQVHQGSFDSLSLSRATRQNSVTRLSTLASSEAIQTIISEEVKELSVCKHCCKLYPISELKEHVKEHSIQDKMHCGFCEKEFIHGGEVSRHQKLCHSRNIQCPFCPTEVSSHQNYINHFLNCHYFDMKNGTLKSKLRHFVCEFCCEVHESRKLHYKTHADFTVCGVCGHKFSRKETVRRHFEHKHQEIKDMVCPFCPNFRGSVNKYIKHYLENHKEGFILKEGEVYPESEEEVAVVSNFDDRNLSESENDTDDDDAQKYHVCEFCSEIHKSLRDHYQKHDDFTVCGFCGIELATKRNIQRHYAMKHKFKKEVGCRLCKVVIGSEKKYIEHYLKEHKGGESSDEDDAEAKLCRQIEFAFNDSNLEEFTPDPTIVHRPDIQNKLPPLKIPKRLLTNKETNEFDTSKAKISKTVHKSKGEDHLDVTNMFSDDDSDSNSLPDFNLDDSNEDSGDKDYKPPINVPPTKSLQDGVPLTIGVRGQVTSNSNSSSGTVFPTINVDSRTENSQTVLTDDDVVNKSPPLPTPTPTPEDVISNRIIGKVICIYCSKVQLDLKEHYKSHSSANFRFCGFCMKRYPNKRYISDHYRFCHKNKNKVSCRFCKHFKSGSEESYINHFMKNHSNIIVETIEPQSRSNKTNPPRLVKKINETDADDVCVKERRRITGVSRDVSHLYVCQYCCEVYGKRSLDIHIKKHSKDALQHCGFCSETLGKDTSVLDHYRSEHRDKENVKCRICPFFKGSQEGYIRHYWKYHRLEGNQIREETTSLPLKELYKCFICEFCGGIYQGLQRHYQSHTDEEMCKCGICGVALAAKSSVLRHYEAVHKKHNDFSCKQCQINIGSEEKYIKHRVQCHLTTSVTTVRGEERIEEKAGASNKNLPPEEQGAGHDGVKGLDGTDNDDYFDEQTKAQVTFECEICNETFSHQYLLKLHRKCHTEDKLKCDLCDFNGYGEEALRLHKRRAHNIKIDKKCEVCDEVFSTHKAYLTHIKSSHDGYFPHPCPDCPKKFFEKKSLSNHVKKFHTPDAKFRYTCKTCNKGFDYKGSFTNHLRLHSNDRPFVCEVCGKGFRNKITLKVHQNIHSDNRPYKCKFCGKGFRQVSTEQNHRRIHTGEKPYMCHICGKSFHDRGHFHAHKKSSHKNELGLNTASKERKPSSIHKSSVPIFPNGNTNPDNVAKGSPYEHNVPYNSEMASAVRSIAEPLDTPRVPPPHQQHAADYQNYFSHVLYPHNSMISHTK